MEQTTEKPNLQEVTKEAQEVLDKASVFITSRANQLRTSIVRQLRDAQVRIRQQTSGIELDAEAQTQVEKVLHRLEEMSDYLENHTVEQLEEQAKAAVQQNVWRNLLIAFIVGLVIGIFLTRRDD
jgi:ElaB/YqjD/DUF883 family membrane-anchored ribosome-binding protein